MSTLTVHVLRSNPHAVAGFEKRQAAPDCGFGRRVRGLDGLADVPL